MSCLCIFLFPEDGFPENRIILQE